MTGQATEWTQLANNTELISLVGKSAEQVNNQITQISQLAEQIQNQLNIYKNMLQNTAQLPNHIWGQVESDLKNLQNVVNQVAPRLRDASTSVRRSMARIPASIALYVNGSASTT